MEQQDIGNESRKSSRRRLSSILKAPRTSMKVLGNEQEEEKQEIVKPVEKRISRRVSFATKHDVHLIANEAKRESLSPLQNATVGLDVLTPHYLSQTLNKQETFFSNPVLEDDVVDKTMLLGDDTGNMDFTQSQTITIQKDWEKNVQAKPIGVPQPCKATVKDKCTVKESDFNDFLASVFLPTPSIKTQHLSGVFSETSASKFETDKENHFPRKPLKERTTNQENPQGLQQRCPSVAFLKEDQIEEIKSYKDSAQPTLSSDFNNQHSVRLAQCRTKNVDVNCTSSVIQSVPSVLDHNRSLYFNEENNAMETTVAFDVTIREKEQTMLEETPHLNSKNQKLSFCVRGNGDEIYKAQHFQNYFSVGQTGSSDYVHTTGALDMSIQESPCNISNMFKCHKFMDGNEKDNVTSDQTRDCDNMDMTDCHTIHFDLKSMLENTSAMPSKQIVAINPRNNHQEKENADCVEETLHTVLNKSGNIQMFQTTESDDMEMTGCHTVFIEPKLPFANKPLIHSRKSLSFKPSSRINQDDEYKVGVEKSLHPISTSNKMPLNLVEIEKSRNISTVQTTDSDGMDLTECHTMTSKPKLHFESNLSRSRNSLCLKYSKHDQESESRVGLLTMSTPPKRTFFDLTGSHMLIDQNRSGNISIVQSNDMEMTECQNNYKISLESFGEQAKCSTTTTGYVESVLIPATAKTLELGKSDCMDLVECSSPCPAEIDFTQCTTVNIETNKTWLGTAMDSTGSRKPHFSFNQTATLVEPMEMTSVTMLPVSMQKHKLSTTLRKSGRRLLPLTSFEDTISCNNKTNSSKQGDVDVSQCQTFEAEEEKSVRKQLNVFGPTGSEDIDFTQALTGNILLKNIVDQHKPEKNLFPRPNSQNLDESNCMELTGQYTDVIDAKSTTSASVQGLKDNDSLLWVSTHQGQNKEHNDVAGSSKDGLDDVFSPKQVPPISDLHRSLCVSNSKEMTSQFLKQVTQALTIPLEKNSFSFIKTQRDDVVLESSVKHDSDFFTVDEQQCPDARRRSLRNLQVKLQTLSPDVVDEQQGMNKTQLVPSVSQLHDMCVGAQGELGNLDLYSVTTPRVKQKPNEKSTPFSLKKRPFSSTLSLGCIVPKLPKRSSIVTPNKTTNITTSNLQGHQVEQRLDISEQNSEMGNINDEKLLEVCNEEDFSQSLEKHTSITEEQIVSLLEILTEEPLEDDIFESPSKGFQRPSPQDDCFTTEQAKTSSSSGMEPHCQKADVKWEGNCTSQTASSSMARAIEETGVSDSTLRHSGFYSHIDGTTDSISVSNQKLEEGSITVKELLNFFRIDLVIHKPRPSALPKNHEAGEACTMEHVLKGKYIYHPKQRVYEQDCKDLTEMVERLQEQIPDQEQSLKSINPVLCQELRTLSKEKLKAFGSKLKEQRIYFGKRSKAVSHEMKGVLYSELLKTTEESSQRLNTQMKETDNLIEDMDRCISDLNAELAAVEAIINENLDASELRPEIKAKDEELHRLDAAVSEKQREISELNAQLMSAEGQQGKLQKESIHLQSHLTTLNSLNEWHLEKVDDNTALFSFLHNTVHLQVKPRTHAGNDWMDTEVEHEIDLTFQMLLDEEKSECHANLVHKLLKQYTQSQNQWMQRYLTTRHVPEMLHEVSLVVGRLRLLGEEIVRLKKWGGLRLRLLKIACVDTRVEIIFASLKAFKKFEFSVTITPDYPYGPLHVQNFRSHVGNTSCSQIEDIVSSVKLGSNYLTKVLKKIYADFLC